MNRRIFSLLVALTLVLATIAPASFAEELVPKYFYRTNNGMLFEKVSHPDDPVETADGIVDYIGNGSVAPYVSGVSEPGNGDRGQSYSYASLSYGDWVYICTMYGGLGASSILSHGMAGLDPEVTKAITDVMYNGNLYVGEPDGAYAGGVLLKFNVKTGETKILMSRDTNGIIPTFRNSFEMNGKLYFVGMILDLKSDLTAVEINTAIAMQSGFPCIYEIDPANGDKMTCVYNCVDINGYRQLVKDNVFTSTRAIGSYKDAMIAGCLDTEGVFLVASKNPSAGQDSFTVIADMDDLFNYPKYHRSDANGGGGIYQVIEYNNALYVVICAGDAASKDPVTGTLKSFAIVKGTCDGDPTRKSSWDWSVLAGDPADGAKYPFGLDNERVSCVACTLQVYGDYLYIGDYNDVSSALQGFVLMKDFTTQATNIEQSINLYRMDRNENIVKVVGDPTTAFPTSLTGLGSGYTSPNQDGYGTHMNQYHWQTTVYNNKMYISTMDTSTFLRPFVALVNGDLFRMDADEWRSQIYYIKVLLELLTDPGEPDAAAVYAAAADVNKELGISTYSSSAFLNEAMITSLCNDAKEAEVIDAAVLAKAIELIDAVEAFYEKYMADGELKVDTDSFPMFAAEYTNLFNKFRTLEASLPGGIESLFNTLISVLTKNNIEGVASSLPYMTEAIPGFDVFELSHTANGGVSIVPVSTNGFGDRYSHGVRIFEETDNYWVIGTASPFYGTQLWRTDKVNTDPGVIDPILPVVPSNPVYPQTGDSANLTLWICLLAASVVGMAGIAARKLRRSR